MQAPDVEPKMRLGTNPNADPNGNPVTNPNTDPNGGTLRSKQASFSEQLWGESNTARMKLPRSVGGFQKKMLSIATIDMICL